MPDADRGIGRAFRDSVTRPTRRILVRRGEKAEQFLQTRLGDEKNRIYAVATLALLKKSAGIGRRNFQTNAIGRSLVRDS